MKNKHKLWLLIAAILLLVVGSYAYLQPSSTPAVILTTNSSDSVDQGSSSSSSSSSPKSSNINSGSSPPKTVTPKCPQCNDTGIYYKPYKVNKWVVCVPCGGTGKIGNATCPTCNGKMGHWEEITKYTPVRCPNCSGKSTA